VSATALWQGAVRASVFPEPPSVSTDQHMVIKLSLLTRRGTITDGTALRGMSFSVVATGDGLAGPVAIPLNDNGTGPDTLAGDGSFAGSFTAPSTPGTLTFTGRVRGYGLYSTPIPATVQVTAARALIEGSVGFPASAATVNPGGTVHGTLTAVNRTGEARRVRLILDTPSATHAIISSPRATFSLPSGNSTTNFTVSFARHTALGGTSLNIRLVDNADPSQVYGAGQLNVTVVKPPTILQRYKWAIAGGVIALLALIALALARRAARRARVSVRGLRAVLSRDGERVGAELRAPSKWADEFRFVIRDADGQYPRLDTPRSEDRPYAARRAAAGKVHVRSADGDRYEILLGSQGADLSNGLYLAFHDGQRRRTTATRLISSAPRPAAQAPSLRPTSEHPASNQPDPWL
jgi:hypothetical protein